MCVNGMHVHMFTHHLMDYFHCIALSNVQIFVSRASSVMPHSADKVRLLLPIVSYIVHLRQLLFLSY